MKALYSHTIQLIEPTKLLERNICDTMTVTNTLQRVFDGEPSSKVSPEVDIKSGLNVKLNEQTEVVFLYSPITIPENAGQVFQVPIYCVKGTVGTFLTQYYFSAIIKITEPNGTVTYYPASGSYDGRDEFNPSSFPSIQYTANQIGTYTIQIFMGYPEVGVSESTASVTVSYNLEVKEATERAASTPWTITDVVNRILSAGVTRRVGIDTQKYVFDETQAANYANVKAPEFFFTRGTLWDALSTVGGFIHAIPRLVDQNREDGRLTVRFDELNSDEEYDMSNLPSVRYYDEQISGEEYCEEIDSPAQNLLNTTDKATGAVTEPSSGGWRAVNCPESDVTIDADTMTFLTDQPIYQVTGLEVKWGQNGTALNAFPYLYEQAEYSVLSSYDGEVYPYSKGWALCYTQGGNEITGLNFTLTTASGANELANNYAIVNILKALGVDINNDADFANNLFYRITYIPQSELRVSQKKPYLTHVGKGTLIYNQGGNTIESEYFGQKMKGAIARIGNVIRRRTFICNKFVKVPKIGQTYSPDGVPEKISNVDCSYEKMYIKVTVTSVPNFNRLAEYTGVNSNYRLYDISEKQSVDRFVHYEESCVISNRLFGSSGAPMITGRYGVSAYKSMFTTADEADNPYKVTAASFHSRAGRTEEDAETGVENNPITLACTSFGFGTSLVFYVNTQDNYGAGRQSSDDYWQASTKKRTSKQVQYGDGLGNLSTMDVTFGTGFAASEGMPFDYPQGNENAIAASQRLLNSASNPFFISKDSREAIHFSYQLHHQADNFDIVIGNGLSRFNPLVSAKRKSLRFIWLAERPLDLINPQLSSYYTDPDFPDVNMFMGSARCFAIGAKRNTTEKTVYGWAIVARGEIGGIEDIVVGQNYPDGLAAGEWTKIIYFNFVDNSVLATLGMAE